MLIILILAAAIKECMVYARLYMCMNMCVQMNDFIDSLN